MANTFGELWRELEDPATVVFTVPATRTTGAVSYTVPYCLLRVTEQRDVVTGDQTLDGHELTLHVWEDHLGGLVPGAGMTVNDGSHTYEIKEVRHECRRQRYHCRCLRIP